MRFLCAALLLTLLAATVLAEDAIPIPELARWEKHMVEFGDKFKDQRALGIMPEQHIYYYDGEWVYFQIADYTRDKKFLEHGQNCEETYRGHVFELDGKLPGWRIHPHGLYEDFKRNKDVKSKEALLLLAKHSHWAPGHPGDGGVANHECCRENAYILMTMILAEDLGEKMPKIDHAVKCGLECLDQYAVSKTAKWIQPFMPGLQCEALIMYADKYKADARVLPTLVTFADWLWEQCWVAKDAAFCYRREEPNTAATKPTEGTADLNLLIAPLYAWLYKKTGEVRFRERGDQAFAGGVKGAWLDKGKAFSQNYRWSFSYVKWRREGPESGAKKAAASKPGGSEFTAGAVKKENAAPSTPAAGPPPVASAALDPAPYRAALEGIILKNAKVKSGDAALIQSLKQEVKIAAIAESGPRIVVQGNELPMRWKDLTHEDIVRLASLYCHDAEGLFNAGALATALKQTTQRDKFIERLAEVDAQKAVELGKLK